MNNHRRGYNRILVSEIGSGALEVLYSILRRLDTYNKDPIYADIEATFDSTVHISLQPDSNCERSKLFVLGKKDVRNGPLLIECCTPTKFSFREHLTNESDTVKIRLYSNGSNLEIGFDNGLKILIDINQMPLLPAGGGIYQQLRIDEFAFRGDLVSLNNRLIEMLNERGLEDGLGLLNELQQYSTEGSSPDIERIVNSITSILKQPGYSPDERIREDQHLPQPIIDLIGRGPGSTPSGDDILLGIFLIIQRVNNEIFSLNAKKLCIQISHSANSMTTQMSSSLLEQVTKKRAAEPAIVCANKITDPRLNLDEITAAAENLIQTGHTSGIDSLIGMLIATTQILPKLNETNH